MTNRSDLLCCITLSISFILSGSKAAMIPLSPVGIESPFVRSLYVKRDVVSMLPSFELTRRHTKS